MTTSYGKRIAKRAARRNVRAKTGGRHDSGRPAQQLDRRPREERPLLFGQRPGSSDRCQAVAQPRSGDSRANNALKARARIALEQHGIEIHEHVADAKIDRPAGPADRPRERRPTGIPSASITRWLFSLISVRCSELHGVAPITDHPESRISPPTPAIGRITVRHKPAEEPHTQLLRRDGRSARTLEPRGRTQEATKWRCPCGQTGPRPTARVAAAHRSRSGRAAGDPRRKARTSAVVPTIRQPCSRTE